jgi:hypothetical protein
MTDKFLPFSPISEGPTEAQSDIADHGYRTKFPPMLLNDYRLNKFVCNKNNDTVWSSRFSNKHGCDHNSTLLKLKLKGKNYIIKCYFEL